jgi:peptidoglycan hydrolase-like protein with peptidoglycan-binding domain
MKKYVLSILFLAMCAWAYALSASSVDIGSSCVNIVSNLRRGDSSDEVYTLQEFLFVQEFLSEKPTGFFGDLTKQAVKDYQKSIGIKESGMAYELTRHSIFDQTCSN